MALLLLILDLYLYVVHTVHLVWEHSHLVFTPAIPRLFSFLTSLHSTHITNYLLFPILLSGLPRRLQRDGELVIGTLSVGMRLLYSKGHHPNYQHIRLTASQAQGRPACEPIANGLFVIA